MMDARNIKIELKKKVQELNELIGEAADKDLRVKVVIFSNQIFASRSSDFISLNITKTYKSRNRVKAEGLLQCSKCKEFKKFNQFYKEGCGDRRLSYCKGCCEEYRKSYTRPADIDLSPYLITKSKEQNQ